MPVQGGVPSLQNLKDAHLHLVGSSRGSSGAIADTIPAQTLQLEQLLAFTLNRNLPDYSASVIFSPADGSVLLSPQPTFRHLLATQEKTGEKTGEKTLLPVAARLFQGEQFLLEIRFVEGQDTVAWQEIPALPERLRDGLAPGDYVLKTDGTETDKVNRFTVKPTELRDWMFGRIARIESLLGPDDPVSVQVAAEMLVHDDVDGPFFTDALDRIAALALAKEKSTPYLENFQLFLALHLSGRFPQKEKESEEEAADAALIHRLLLNEKWSVASIRLDRLEEKLEEKLGRSDDSVSMRELRALCSLYRGMILAESGVSRLQEGYAAFSEAVRQLDAIADESAQNAELVAASRFRTANNFGNFLLRLTQDRLYNHALAMATGDGTVLTGALLSWSQALSLYQSALSLSESFLPDQPELAATAKINLARLYAVLGDMVRTVDSAEAFDAIEQAALTTATKLANEVIGMNLPNEERLKGAAHHILADLAFRQSDLERCVAEAALARWSYVQTGTLSGVEAIERLLGMLETDDDRKAIHHLTVSMTLTEFLREQMPDDATGMTRAGFFARRAYVNERAIKLLLKEKRCAEALQLLENAKAGTLRDMLIQAGIPFEENVQTRTIASILADWPKNMVALEYYIGTEISLGFIISSKGVESFRLMDEKGQAVSSAMLIALIRNIRSELVKDAQNKQLFESMKTNSWHDKLVRLSSILIPESILATIRSNAPEKLLIIPHHVLHYVPFVSLITNPDATDRREFDIKRPEYLLDEPFYCFYAPSLSIWTILCDLAEKPMSSITLVGIIESGKRLDNVAKEIDQITDVFQSSMVSTEKLIDKQVTTDTILNKVLPARGMIFWGTHGNESLHAPLQSSLDLYGDDKLTARDVYNTTVGADMVFLGACHSGIAEGAPMPGDDLFGIQRAFIHSGAKTVVSSLWEVQDDVSPKISGKMMTKMRHGMSVAKAMAESQKEYLDSLRKDADNGNVSVWLHPYAWAVYAVIGDDRTRFMMANQ